MDGEADLLDNVHSPLTGAPLLLVDASCLRSRPSADTIVIGVDRSGSLPWVDPDCCDALVTVWPDAPAPWVSISKTRFDARLGTVRRNVANAPVAASLLARLLRFQLPFAAALTMESLAYSTLLGGREFAAWLQRRPLGASEDCGAVRYEREGGRVTLTLDCPGTRNAMTAAMRDALFEALANVVEDPSEPALVLRGAGRCFSTGGDPAEFGTARDLAAAHVIRSERSCAALLHRLGHRAEARVHGACIGSGIEVAAGAGRVIGAPDTFIQLPELSMGLIPGAGGTVTVTRRIGRHRAAWLALSGIRLAAGEALAWGLLDAIEP